MFSLDCGKRHTCAKFDKLAQLFANNKVNENIDIAKIVTWQDWAPSLVQKSALKMLQK